MKPDIYLLVLDDPDPVKSLRSLIASIADELSGNIIILEMPNLKMAQSHILDADMLYADICEKPWFDFAVKAMTERKIPVIMSGTRADEPSKSYGDFWYIEKYHFDLKALSAALKSMTELAVRKKAGGEPLPI